MKVGRHFTRLRALIDMMGLTQKSWFVSHASLPHEQSCALADAPDKAPYFSLILILKETDEWTG
jgi:precorrin-2/cobalt-factor-2 C20-methyltransferase